MVKLFIDPGHGGTDPGAVGNSLQEKNLTLQIAAAMQEILIEEYENIEIRLSRSGDETLSLSARTNAANRWDADYFVSIHINSGGGTGFESFIHSSAGRSTATYQDYLHEDILKESNFTNRGQKAANFHVLRETTMPAILTENGFIDTAADANKLKDSSFIEKLARGHVNGIARAFQLKRKQTIPNPSTLYKVQIGAFKERANAESLAAEAKAKGLDSIVKQEDNLYKVQIGAFSSRENAEQLAEEAKSKGFNVYIS
ncbi:N-acetylmuramoyl-L-alanine amidase [Metabacillus fastidiosus]|uniref:N-acetylmuramoyl-L-alanine amidase n=1 Tax=Metabacillus fastidiosus TaxID=1458 RepID=UPI003D2C449D